MIIREMTKEECLDALTKAGFGRLACARDNQPYIVPVYFACDKSYLYGVATEGKKTDWMRSNPLVCVEADEILYQSQWKSVIAFGRYEELPDIEKWRWVREHAHTLLQKRPNWWQPASVATTHRGIPHSLTPLFYRIRIDQITGHQALLDQVEEKAASASSPTANRGWLRHIIRRKDKHAAAAGNR